MKFILSLCLFLFSGFSNSQGIKDTVILRIEKINSLKTKAIAYDNAALKSWMEGKYELSILYANKGLAICESNNFPKITASLLNNKGIAYDYKGDFSAALTNYFQALELADHFKDPNLKASILSNIGLIYSSQTMGDKALNYHFKSLKIRKEIKDSAGISASLNNIAIVYAFQKKIPEAIKKYKECIEIDKKIGDDQGLGDDYNNIGLSYMNLGEFETAMLYFDMSLNIRDSLKNPLGVLESYLNIGSLHYKIGDYKKSAEIFKKSLPLAQNLGRKVSIRYIYENLANIEEKAGNAQEALNYYRLYTAYKDSIDNSESARIQTEMEMQYKFDKEKADAKLIQDQKEAHSKLILYSVFAGLILIIIFSLLLLNRWKKTQGQKKVIEEKSALLELKNEEITDSINYAKRIQTAILPSKQLIQEIFPQNFVLYLPKDIVAGDFYWLENINDHIFFAVADCTGHGVPGAMMSVVCHNALNRCVREYGLSDPGEILDKTREIIVSELSKNDQSVADGMDISLVVCNSNNNCLKWAGANNPLWILRKNTNEFEEWKANKQPIGLYDDYQKFESHEISLYENDRIFLFTDGFADQFGGESGKKLMRKSFQDLLKKTSAYDLTHQRSELEKFFYEWKGNLEQIDDVCVAGIII